MVFCFARIIYVVAVFLDIILVCQIQVGYGSTCSEFGGCSFLTSGLPIALLVGLVPVRHGVDTSMGRTRSSLPWLRRCYMKFNADISSVVVW